MFSMSLNRHTELIDSVIVSWTSSHMEQCSFCLIVASCHLDLASGPEPDDVR